MYLHGYADEKASEVLQMVQETQEAFRDQGERAKLESEVQSAVPFPFS